MSDSNDNIREVRQLIHDTLSQTLFSASTLAGLLVDQIPDQDTNTKQAVVELNILVKDAVTELQSIQKRLYEMTDDG